MLLAASSLTTRYWVGSLWTYSDPSVAPAVDKCVTGIDSDAGITRVAFVGKEQKQARRLVGVT